MKTTNKNETEPADKQQFKKRYLVRKLQEQEAEEEIKRYQDEDKPLEEE